MPDMAVVVRVAEAPQTVRLAPGRHPPRTHRDQPLRPGGMRNLNQSLVLTTVARGDASRAQLAATTGLTKSSVSAIVRDLMVAGLVRERGQVHSGDPGRPGTAVTLQRDGFAGLGLAIGVGTLSACVVDLGRRVRFREIRTTLRAADPDETFAELGRVAAAALTGADGLGLTVVGVALAVPGPVEPAGGVLRQAPNLGWLDVPTGALLARYLPRGLAHQLSWPPAIDNEAHLAAFGEQWFGGVPGLRDFVGVFGDIGIGGALIVDGAVFRGRSGMAGELGHMVVDPAGDSCACGGRGCLETIAGMDALARAAGVGERDPLAVGATAGPVEEIIAALCQGRPLALRAASRAADALGLTLASVVDLMDPEAIVIGGSLALLQLWLTDRVEAALARHSMPRARRPPVVHWSSLGQSAAVLGAAGLVTEHVLSDPGPLVAAASIA